MPVPPQDGTIQEVPFELHSHFFILPNSTHSILQSPKLANLAIR